MAFDFPKLDKIYQLGFLVKNLDEVKKQYEEVFGIGPWSEPGVISGDRFPIWVNGEKYEGPFFKVSMLHRYGFEIELIEPIGPGPLKDWVDKHGNGLHHIDFRLADQEKFEEFLAEAKEITGKDPWLAACFGRQDRISFAYLDMTEELGCYVEVKPNRTPENEAFGFEY